MEVEELMQTDNFKSLRLVEQIYLIINKTPIDTGEKTVQIGSRKSAEMAEKIINLLKSYGDLYQEEQTEEITFAEPTWFITIPDAKLN